MDTNRKSKTNKSVKNPYNKREEKDKKEAFKCVERGVKPVVKDTNKTRRPRVKPTKGKRI